MRFFGPAAGMLAWLLFAACGGRTQDPGSTNSTTGGTAGSSAGGDFGGVMTGGDPAPGQSTPANPTGGVTSPNTTLCQQICDRIQQAMCVVPDCVNECSGQVITHPNCAPQLDAVLKCFSIAPIGCAMGSEGVKFFGCDNERNVANQCVSPAPLPPSDPGVPPTQPIPSQCIGMAPLPPSGMVCSGGSAGGSGSTGGNAPPTCQSQCNDNGGNVWSSFCVGANCSCLFNGKTYCSCVSAAPCSSCCPGGI